MINKILKEYTISSSSFPDSLEVDIFDTSFNGCKDSNSLIYESCFPSISSPHLIFLRKLLYCVSAVRSDCCTKNK